MNATQMIDKAIELVDDRDYEDRAEWIILLNQAQKAIADTLFLPDLNDGFDQVTALTSAFSVALPSDYHKGLHTAVSGSPLNIHRDRRDMSLMLGGFSLESGTLTDVTVHNGLLIYQSVPTAAQLIDLHYYHKPTPMTDDAASLPDGAVGVDDFEWAVIHHAVAKVFTGIEDGMEGNKLNTSKHEELFGQRMVLLSGYCEQQGILYPFRPSASRPWLGYP